MTSTFSPGLRTLLQIDDPRTFLDQCWPDRHVVVHGPIERLTGFADISAAEDVRALLEHGHTYRRADYRSSTQFFSVENPSIEEAYHLYQIGFTLYVYDVDSPAFNAWKVALAEELNLPPGGVVMTAFASRPGAGSRAHFDAQENFMVQVRGHKRWRIAPNKHVAYPSDNYFVGSEPNATLRKQIQGPLPQDIPEDALTVDMQPGSVMFLPRGYWHETDTVEDSLHWVVQAQVPIWSDVLQFILKHTPLMHELPWRSPVARAWKGTGPSADLMRELGAKLRELGSWLEQANAEELLGSAVREQVQQEMIQSIKAAQPTLNPPPEGR
ncbi:JmjC domain-containing protein [Polyangium mundeleinium]|uniref:Cupin domain-containing protein n=1 Tax=Polyangium mundeleinium TaxID=2995306 RepID=A0ABT5F6H2_9BACT|nr:cupin domain-containing protein [Polyangium mundeleinium]MDC0749705.1 cupin domain-containing protein [Polyangium mundeleinium]